MVPTRVDIRTSTKRRDQFIEGVGLLKQELHPASARLAPLTQLSTYDGFVLWHADAMMTVDGNLAHLGSVFLPWHRYFLLVFEEHMRRVLGDATFAVPYWNWADDGARPPADQTSAPIWGPDYMGGTGTARTGEVADGPFTVANGFRVFLTSQRGGTPFAIEGGMGLTRNLGQGDPLPVQEEVAFALKSAVYDESPWDTTTTCFRARLEGFFPRSKASLHNRIHDWIGGDMVKATSPNDPVFFLHHSNIDRIWLRWQQKYPSSPYVPDQGQPSQFKGQRIDDALFTFGGPAITIRDVLDVSTLVAYDTLADI